MTWMAIPLLPVFATRNGIQSSRGESCIVLVMIFFAILLAPPLACAEESILHRFVATDTAYADTRSSKNAVHRLFLVDQRNPTANWAVVMPPGNAFDLQLVENDRVLVENAVGASEYRLSDGKEVWNVTLRLARGQQIRTARRLPTGHTILGMMTEKDIVIVEIDAEKKEVGRMTVLAPHPHSLRLMRRLENGNTLIGLAYAFFVIEVDSKGQIVTEFKLGEKRKGHLGVRLPNGNTRAGTGQGLEIVEFDPQGSQISFVGGKTHKHLQFQFFAAFDVLKNGHIVVANWCHWCEGPHLVEFDRLNNVIWQWADETMAKQVHNVIVLE